MSADVHPAPPATDQVVFRDDFEAYGAVSDLRRGYARAGAISFVDGRGGSGKAVRFSYGSETYNLLEKSIAATSDLFVSYWYRTSPGADPSNAGRNGWGMSLLRAERDAGGRWQLGTYRSSLDFGLGDNSASTMPDPFYQNVATTPRFGSTNDGTWHQLTTRLVAGADGYALLWIDGRLVMDTRGKGYRHAAAGITLLRFPGEMAATPSSPFTIDIDDVVVWAASGDQAPPTDTTTPPADTTSPPVDTTTPPPADTASPPPADTTPAPVARVTVSPSTVSLVPNGTTQLSVALHDADGNILSGRSVSWSSSNTAVATVSSTGSVRAIAQGSAVVTATSEGRSASAQVSVAPVPVASVSVTLNSSSVLAGNSTQAVATARDADGNVLSGRSVTWQSSNTSVATVSASGLVSAVSAGSASISATIEGRTGQAALTVTAPPAPVASVTVSPSSASLEVGGTTQLIATARDASGSVLTGRAVTWSSTNTAVATVSSTGVVRAVAAGSATIRATSEGQVGSAAIAVTSPPPTSGAAPEPTSTSRVLFQDAFNGTSLSGYARRGSMTMVPGRSGNAVQFNYSTSSADNLIEREFPASGDVYIRYWYKTSPGADPTCSGRNGSGFKWFMAWRSGGPRYTMGASMLDNGGPGSPRQGIEFTSHDNSSQRQPDPFLQNISKAKRFDTTNDGQWHKYTLHIKTGNGGYERIWVDDLLVLDNQAYGYDHSSVGVSMFQFPGAVVSMSSGCDFTVTVDDFVIWER